MKTLAQPPFPKKTIIQAPTLLDFYKCFHHVAYKEGVSEVLINFTARSGKHSNVKNPSGYMWGGGQGFISEIVVDVWNEFFAASKEDAVADYKRVNEGGLGVPCDTSHLEALHDLGYMPLEFRALLEGVEVPYGVAAMTCMSTHDSFFFLPNMIETIWSCQVWPTQTSLSTSTEYMATIHKFAAIDGTPEWLYPFLGHDFSMRGMMGGTISGAAAISGSGHLMSGFVGSDTLPAALYLEKNYGAYLGIDRPFETIASVNATEHSVQCSFNNDDLAYFKHCMKVSPTGILSLVSDGYDFWKLITHILPLLKDEIMARQGKIVIRPDSGDPADVLCGLRSGFYSEKGGKYFLTSTGAEVSKEEVDGLIVTLWNMFGGTKTESGYKMLDEHIGAIYGDSITLERQADIYSRLHAKGFAIGNVVLGIGSYSFQHVTRDTHGSAVKATNMIIDGVDTAISKEVKGDAIKKSAKGRLVVRKENGKFVQYDQCTPCEVEGDDNCLEPVWRDGAWIRVQTLTEIRANVADVIKTRITNEKHAVRILNKVRGQ